MKAALLSVTLAALAYAQPALTPPQVGFIQDGANSFRPVYGFAGNFVLGLPVTSNVVSSAFSGFLGLVNTGAMLTLTDSSGQTVATTDAPSGPAFFAFSQAGSRALAFFPGSSSLLVWNGLAFRALSFDQAAFPSNSVQSIALPDGFHAAFIIQRDSLLWDVRIRLATGEVDSQTALPEVTAPVLLLATGDLVWSDANGIVIRRQDGSEIHLTAQLPGNFSLQQMGDGWVQGRDPAGAAQFTIRVTSGHEAFFALPEVRQ